MTAEKSAAGRFAGGNFSATANITLFMRNSLARLLQFINKML